MCCFPAAIQPQNTPGTTCLSYQVRVNWCHSFAISAGLSQCMSVSLVAWSSTRILVHYDGDEHDFLRCSQSGKPHMYIKQRQPATADKSGAGHRHCSAHLP